MAINDYSVLCDDFYVAGTRAPGVDSLRQCSEESAHPASAAVVDAGGVIPPRSPAGF